MAEARRDAASLGTTLRTVRHNRESASIDRRFQSLIDSEREQLPFRLRQAVRLAAASDQAIDWEQLLNDLLAWEYEGKPVQRRWARDYFVGRRETDA
jgi:CRISPR system Cascade subunit CasB